MITSKVLHSKQVWCNPTCFFILVLCLLAPLNLLAKEPLKVVVSIPVLERFLEEIASGDVHVTPLTKPGGSAHVFEPSAAQIVAIRKSQLFFALPSLSHERGYLKTIQRLNKEMRVINLEDVVPAGFAKDRSLHHDPHTWMAPEIVVAMVDRMVIVLSEERPENAVAYRSRGNEIVQALRREDRVMRESLKQVNPASFLAYHPSFGYFAKAYGLKQHALEREGKSISASYLRRVLLKAKKTGVKTFVINPGLDEAMVSRVTDFMPCQVLSLDVLDPDIFAVWRQLTAALLAEQ